MRCPACGGESTLTGSGCAACGASVAATATGVLTPVPDDLAVTRIPEIETVLRDPGAAGSPTGTRATAMRFGIGHTFGTRYHIIRVLGQGGMGCVYHAWDAELGVAVALKVIRPEITEDPAGAAEIERRFKRELLLARQVSHKNVVRIHDLGDIDGTKYITMAYVEGADLAALISREGKQPVARTLRLARDIAAGLQAAHEVGIVHRDLKPGNIMVGPNDQAQIMDFGIARSAINPGFGTMSGAVVGTLEYMAPEQAQGSTVDARADLYAFGLILYDLLIGRRPTLPGESAVAALVARMKAPPPSPRSFDPSIPEALDALVVKCVQPEPGARFQTAAELVAAIDLLDAHGLPRTKTASPRMPKVWLAAAALALTALVGSATWWVTRSPAPPAKREPVSVLITNFVDRTDDPIFRGALEQALGLAVEESRFVTVYPRDAALRLAQRIKPGSTLDESVGRLITLREGIKVILTGSIERQGDGYKLVAAVIDPANGNALSRATAFASSKGAVLQAVGSMATDIREALGDVDPESARRAADETFTAASLEAARDFSAGQDLASAGKHEEAIASYRQAIARDSQFGRAYASWATSAAILGRREESAEAYKHALSLVDRMTEREKYRTLGTYYLTTARNYDKAVENYRELVRLYPADRTGHHNLALAHFYLLDFPEALEEGRRALEIYPKNETSRNNVALYAMYAGDFDTAAAEARRVIEQNPNLAKAYLPLAMGALAKGDVPAAREAYERMSTAGTFGASLSAMGAADLALYEGRFADAEASLTAGLAADEKAKNTAGMSAKLLALAELYLQLGRIGPAVAHTQRAVKLGQDETVVVPAARVLVRAGDAAGARALAIALGQQLQPQRRAYGKVVEAEIALYEKRPGDAVNVLREGQKLADVWLGRFNLGIAYVEAGHNAEALAELELAHKRRGEATAIFLDDVPSYRYLVPLPYWLARAQEALGVDTAFANYSRFLTLRTPATKDALAIDAERRLRARPPT